MVKHDLAAINFFLFFVEHFLNFKSKTDENAPACYFKFLGLPAFQLYHIFLYDQSTVMQMEKVLIYCLHVSKVT